MGIGAFIKIGAGFLFVVALPTALYFFKDNLPLPNEKLKATSVASKDNLPLSNGKSLEATSVSKGIVGDKICLSAECKKTAEKIINDMDKEVNPCNNFYRFACGKYIENAKIPDDGTSISSFITLNNEVDRQLEAIVHEKPSNSDSRTHKMMKQVFSMCMDEDSIQRVSKASAMKRIVEAGGWPTLGLRSIDWNFLTTEIYLRKTALGGGSLFTLSVGEDNQDPTKRIFVVDYPTTILQKEVMELGGLDQRVNDYRSHLLRLAELLGANSFKAALDVNEVMKFQIKLAQAMQTINNEHIQRYNPFKLSALMADSRLNWINWRTFVQGILPPSVQLKEDDVFNVRDIEFFVQLKNILDSTPKEVVANHMMWHTVFILSRFLNKEVMDANFKYHKKMTGVEAPLQRWKHCLYLTSSLQIAMSALYVKRHFDERSRKTAVEISKRIREEMKKDLNEVNWMNTNTKDIAIQKIDKLKEEIGYPPELNDDNNIETEYNELRINEENFFEAVLDMGRWTSQQGFRLLREPVVKNDWREFSDVFSVNAYYSPYFNVMQFPAAILQAPLFNDKVPHYLNYGAIGQIMANQITHGFDATGRLFDGEGAFRPWWDPNTEKEFNTKAQCFIDQYSNLDEPTINMKVDGVTTRDVNIADNGGLKLAYSAYQKLVAEKGSEPGLPGLEKYNNNQMFLISLANLQCTAYRTEALQYSWEYIKQVTAEPKINGMIMNMPEFGKLFNCPKGAPMNPENKCSLW